MADSPPLRVALVIPAYLPAADYGGPVVKLGLLSTALMSLGVRPQIWTADYDVGRGRVPPGTRQVGEVAVRYFRRLAGYHWSPVVPHAAIAAAGSQVDIAQCFGMRDGLTHFAAQGFRRGGTPYLVETLGMHAPRVRSLGRKRFYDWLVGNAYVGGAAGLVATSELEEEALRVATACPVWLRYNPLQLGGRLAVAGDMRAVMRVPRAAPLLGWLGRISRSKGLELLVRAVEQLDGVHLVIAGPDDGDGAMSVLGQAIRACRVQDRVHLLGPVWGPERDLFLGSIDAFALPSVTENFGNAAAEAAAAGLPVVVSDQCGVARLLECLGAALVVPLDVRALRDGLAAALAQPRPRTGPGTPAAALAAELSPESIARRQVEIYEEVLARTSARSPS